MSFELRWEAGHNGFYRLTVSTGMSSLTLKADLTAVGGLIRAIHAVIVPITHPHSRDAALTHGTLELVWCTCDLSCSGNTHN